MINYDIIKKLLRKRDENHLEYIRKEFERILKVHLNNIYNELDEDVQDEYMNIFMERNHQKYY
jgi:hypothetical protein